MELILKVRRKKGGQGEGQINQRKVLRCLELFRVSRRRVLSRDRIHRNRIKGRAKIKGEVLVCNRKVIN